MSFELSDISPKRHQNPLVFTQHIVKTASQHGTISSNRQNNRIDGPSHSQQSKGITNSSLLGFGFKVANTTHINKDTARYCHSNEIPVLGMGEAMSALRISRVCY